ncbi:DegT/DnrJ/EryC1/StrS family aminotransferase [Methylocucumis oryzae]|uniref:DegT/DnrJ/EryC1/StrS aminotransferase n=1 Tax=Methylocucumis oryzae TaxID=1632867 RepID=A0A0F3IFH7_9GAMM|nr:DegT/DnrJ/EryC1/StrS family aminotransferase [Methylocucumis oryzae]KJV05545.1 hypothetical protein VZ94_17415 [Methylocucumis oryzae]
MCKSATDALFVACYLKAIATGKPLRWVVSGYGFFSTHIGCLANSLVLDCDEQGLLSFEALKALPIDAWDGMVVTNMFGLFDDLSEYNDFCRIHGKAIIIDNALGFCYPGRQNSDAPDEVISFHQTKPWGMGEGGCLIVNKTEQALAKSLINFGVESSNTQVYAMNSKLSDFDSALILQRLLHIDDWLPLYRQQTQRVKTIAQALGGRLLVDIADDKFLGHVPVLFPKPISAERIAQQHQTIQFGKYYLPLAPGLPQASALYQHILNIPSHSGMAMLTDAQIRDAIVGVLNLN